MYIFYLSNILILMIIKLIRNKVLNMSKDNFIDLHTAHTVIYDSILRSPE